MNALATFWHTYGTRMMGVLGGALGTFFASLTPDQLLSLLNLPGAKYAPLAIALLTFLKGQQNANRTKRESLAVPPTDTGAGTARAHWIVTLLACGMALTFGVGVVSTLTGCKTAPTATQAIALDASVAAAVGITIQRGTNDPVVWSERGRIILSVVEKVRPLLSDEALDVTTLVNNVADIVNEADIKPSERPAANMLVQSLVLVIHANTPPDSPTMGTVRMVLESAARAATAYVMLDQTAQ